MIRRLIPSGVYDRLNALPRTPPEQPFAPASHLRAASSPGQCGFVDRPKLDSGAIHLCIGSLSASATLHFLESGNGDLTLLLDAVRGPAAQSGGAVTISGTVRPWGRVRRLWTRSLVEAISSGLLGGHHGGRLLTKPQAGSDALLDQFALELGKCWQVCRGKINPKRPEVVQHLNKLAEITRNGP